jgi:hypothetical protein
MDEDEQVDQLELQKIRAIKKNRLAELYKQRGRFGYTAPPEVHTEIRDLEKNLGIIEPVLSGDLDDDTLMALRNYGLSAAVNNTIQAFQAQLYELKRAFEKRGEKEDGERADRQKQQDERFGKIEAQQGILSTRIWWLVLVNAVAVTALITLLASR